jgi:hypothetical protein
MSGVVKTIAKPIQSLASPVARGLGDITGYTQQQQAQRLAEEAAKRSLAPRFTQYGSSINPGTGSAVIDPSIRAMRDSSVAGIPGYRSGYESALGTYRTGIDDYLARTRGYLGDLNGNMNPYIQARVNPLLERASLGRGSLERGLALRGLGGSSFAAQSLGSYDTATSRAEADQRAQALQEAFAARDALSQGILGAQTNLAGAQSGVIDQNRALDQQLQTVAQQNLQQELAALGLTAPDIQAILGSAQALSQAGQAKANLFGQLLDAGGSFLKGAK